MQITDRTGKYNQSCMFLVVALSHLSPRFKAAECDLADAAPTLASGEDFWVSESAGTSCAAESGDKKMSGESHGSFAYHSYRQADAGTCSGEKHG
jgi:hypothetical protein